MLADRLGVSRTPIVDALTALHKEGLLEYAPHRGYAVKPFGLSDLMDAFDVRMTLEGLACRVVAERGLSAEDMTILERNLAETEMLLFGPEWSHAIQDEWMRLNYVFHDLFFGRRQQRLSDSRRNQHTRCASGARRPDETDPAIRFLASVSSGAVPAGVSGSPADRRGNCGGAERSGREHDARAHFHQPGSHPTPPCPTVRRREGCSADARGTARRLRRLPQAGCIALPTWRSARARRAASRPAIRPKTAPRVRPAPPG